MTSIQHDRAPARTACVQRRSILARARSPRIAVLQRPSVVVALCIFMPAILSAAPAAAASADSSPRGWLGIYTEPVAELPAIEEAAGGAAALQGATCGLRVDAVIPDSPADSAGLTTGDLIISVLGKPFACPPESVRAVFKRTMDALPPQAPCSLRIVRNAVTKNVTAAAFDRADLLRRFWRHPSEVIDSLASGDTLHAVVAKQQRVLDLLVVLGERPEARWPAPRSNEEIYPPDRFPTGGLDALVWALADSQQVRDDTQDLLERLARCHRGADPFRLECMIYAHRAPMRIEALSRAITDGFAQAGSALDLVARGAPLLVPEFTPRMPLTRRLQSPAATAPIWREADPDGPDTPTPTPSAPNDEAMSMRDERAVDASREALDALIEQVTAILAEARQWHRRAFAALTPDERTFLERERWNLSDAFAGQVYIHFDEDPDRFPVNKRILAIAAKIDHGALCEAGLRLALLTDPEWVMHAGRVAYNAFADSIDNEILLDRETPYGRILIGGTSPHWYRGLDTAFILDLGGDDFYTGNCGGSGGWDLPLSVCVDLEGDDAYESTRKGCQGAGCLGVGGLLDLSGDDHYIGLQWCQGAAYAGIGWLHDLSGDDVYRGRTFCQGVGLFGMGWLLDEDGRDRYEADAHAQGVGLARGIGVISDRRGDDEYYAKGLYPTGYGDAGIFEAWSQGCAQGFRTLASGGLGVVVDGGGADRMEAGNFSQGGGYYYGLGALRALGADDDVYIGSRYNQGFCAHQALGVLIEDGGNDLYTTRQGVAQGLAWDECVTLFVDAGGQDIYEGGRFFSQGAAAHNSFCFFFDRGGRDIYRYAPGQARAGGNGYHGGTSFALFVDERGSRDVYTSAGAANGVARYKPQHGFFLDLDGTRYERWPSVTAENPRAR